ncbi:acyl-CoA synthetase [Novosphingobium sp. KCTC 2891]|uniref:acyl-CoA synthetase n=1 Tax=Novosphingobium sp. KCTC 2891 TaxID=2989730 RepID=UPI002222ADDB|nr:acyl-CoA synthetase [Novosphingobium sp. KCTC 2891]MCW1381915.1 acyl-CoA synthetase [Novosphingobium sp. KCTC 2891]
MGWIKSGDQTLTPEQFDARARKAATVLQDFGIVPGDGVALYLRNDLAYFEAVFAAGMLGAYPVPVNWHYTPDEAGYLLRDSAVKLLIIHADLLPPIAEAVPEGLAVVIVDTPPEVRAAYGLPETTLPAGAPLWGKLVDAAAQFAGEPQPPLSSIIYTSGTTGRPKGVRRAPFTPEQGEAVNMMLARSYGYMDVIEGRAAPDSITTAVIGPVYHSAPNAHSAFSIRLGANVVICPRFDAEELLQLIEREKITHLNMVPIMFNRLLRLPEEVKRKYDLSSLRFITHAAAPCPPPVKRAMIEWWGPVINEYYGSTEMGNVTSLTSEEWLAHPGSVGRIMPGVDLRVVDEAGNDVPPGTIGEVIGRGRHGSDFTYQNAPEKRAAMEKYGLITPGDVGYFDADGFLYLCDRKNDMIISGGANIYPAEIEAELHKLPGVADCAVFGIPDEEFGESVMAVVQPMPGVTLHADDLKAELRRVMTAYKVPRRIDFADSLPREDSGKIFKRKLREPFWAGRERAI